VRLIKIGFSRAPDMTADAVNTYIISEIARWGIVIKKAGIHLNN